MKGLLALLAVSLFLLLGGCSNDNGSVLGPDSSDNSQTSEIQTDKAITNDVLFDGDDEGDPWEDKGLGNDGDPGPPFEDPGFRRGGHNGGDHILHP